MKKVLIFSGAAIAFALVVTAVAADFYVRGLAPRARIRLIRDLGDRFDADVELKSLRLSILPVPTVSGDGLVIRHRGWTTAHPLIVIARFTASTGASDLLWQRDKIGLVTLEGLEIHVPPKGRSAFEEQPIANHQVESATPGTDRSSLRISIGKIVANDSLLEIEPKTPGKDPRQFHIEELTMYSVGGQSAMSFSSRLNNATPPGIIETEGSFGPWQKDDPRSTPLFGAYTFDSANLGVFKGIRGTLSSRGSFGGVLQHIEVNGTTDTPDFALKRSGATIHLRTTFHSIVNGTDGETILDPVDAAFLHSEFVCRGGVVKEDGNPAKTVDLYAVAKHARMEDILQLVTGEKCPIVTGDVDFDSHILVPPGHGDVLNKLGLQGQFKLLQAFFTSETAERRLATLSARAQGITKAQESDLPLQRVASNLIGTFQVHNGIASFEQLSFGVPGAEIRLAGDYALGPGTIAMNGFFRMRATLAQTQSGIKRVLLKPLDPIFEKDGAGFQIPLHISGSREKPTISVEAFHHTFTLK